MKTKIVKIASSISLILISAIIISFNCSSKNGVETKNGAFVSKKFSRIECKGEKFDKYPSLDGIHDKVLHNMLASLPKIEVEEFYQKSSEDLDETTVKHLFVNFKKFLGEKDGFINYQTRIDGEKLGWSAVAMLPTNGEFFMIILRFYDKESYAPTSHAYYMATFKLSGEMLSIIYLYGYEEVNDNELNKEKVNLIKGRGYCLNTNKPIVRRAVGWDYYINRGGFKGIDLEVKQIMYSIENSGIIKAENEKILFPRTHKEWKDRSGISFNIESDTVKKLLGEIE